MQAVTYSSGESGDEENKLGRTFLKMKEKEKRKRIRNLWYRMLAKLKGAVLVLDRFSYLTRRIYLFGTSKKLKFVTEQVWRPAWYIILPDSKPRHFWNFIVLLLLLYTATMIPYRTAFIDTDDPSSFIVNWEIFIDSLYILDFFLTFLMAFEDKDKKIEIRLRLIAINYLKTWFLLDFVSCLPF